MFKHARPFRGTSPGPAKGAIKVGGPGKAAPGKQASSKPAKKKFRLGFDKEKYLAKARKKADQRPC